MKLTKKQLFAAGLAVAAFAGAGAAIAASRPTPKEEQKAVIDDAAKQLGVAPDKLQSALQQALVNRIEQAVKDGRLTREQADRLEARIKAGDVPITPGFGDGGPGFGGPGFRHHGGDRGGFGLFGDAFAAAQTYLGVTDAQLQQALQSGKSLADIAKDKGKTTAGLQKAMVDAVTKAADQAVKDGKLTKEQRDAVVSKATQWVQHEITETHDGHRGFGGPFGGPGDDGPPPSGSGNGTGDGGQNAPSGDILQSV
jgi:hypothetical protein